MGGVRIDDEVCNIPSTFFHFPQIFVCMFDMWFYWLPYFNRFIYTGSVEITQDISQDLLKAADQYLLEGLKRLCEYEIAQVGKKSESLDSLGLSTYILVLIIFSPLFQDVSLDNISSMYELSEAFHAMSLRHTCVLFVLEQFDKISTKPG